MHHHATIKAKNGSARDIWFRNERIPQWSSEEGARTKGNNVNSATRDEEGSKHQARKIYQNHTVQMMFQISNVQNHACLLIFKQFSAMIRPMRYLTGCGISPLHHRFTPKVMSKGVSEMLWKCRSRKRCHHIKHHRPWTNMTSRQVNS